jgi:thiamine-phosphate pyrophosphorylase
MRLDPSLYVIVDRTLLLRLSAEDAAAQCVRGGATAVQLRMKDASGKEFYETALRLKRGLGSIPLLINDRLDVALACESEGVHLGETDVPISRARAILGPDRVIGYSPTTMESIDRAIREGADYLGIGAIYPTPSKPEAKALGLEFLRAARERVGSEVPLVAIGGITLENARDVLEAGATTVTGLSMFYGGIEKPLLELTRALREISR